MKHDKRIEAGKKRLEECRVNQRRVHVPPPEHPNERHLRDIKMLLFIVVATAVIAGCVLLVLAIDATNREMDRLGDRMDRAVGP